MWSWDISYLPTSVRGIWLYLYLVIDVWSRKVVAWDVAEREDPKIAAELVSRACLRERVSRRRRQPLILHADNGNALGVCRSKQPSWALKTVFPSAHDAEVTTFIPLPWVAN